MIDHLILSFVVEHGLDAAAMSALVDETSESAQRSLMGAQGVHRVSDADASLASSSSAPDAGPADTDEL